MSLFGFLFPKTESETTLERISQAITDVSISAVQHCVSNVKQEQTAEIVNTGWFAGGTVTVEQETEIKSSCFSDSSLSAKLQNDIINTIMQSSTSTGQAIFPAFNGNSAKARTHLETLFKNGFSMQNVQKSYNDIKQKQTVKFINAGVMAGVDINVRQGAKVFAAAVLKQVENLGVFNTIEEYIKQEVETKNENFLTEMFRSVTGSFLYFFLFIAMVSFAIFIGIPFLLSLGGGGGGGSSGSN